MSGPVVEYGPALRYPGQVACIKLLLSFVLTANE